MSEQLPTAPYRGTRDFLPAEMSVREQVFDRLYRVIESFGYQRYDGPILESAEIYEAKSGREIADQQLYTLTDRGGRRLALRPEMTPSVARMIAGHANELTFPARWYCNVNCHRYERPQRGCRLRRNRARGEKQRRDTDGRPRHQTTDVSHDTALTVLASARNRRADCGPVYGFFGSHA